MRSIFFTTAILSAIAAGLAFGVGNAMSATAVAQASKAVTVVAEKGAAPEMQSQPTQP